MSQSPSAFVEKHYLAPAADEIGAPSDEKVSLSLRVIRAPRPEEQWAAEMVFDIVELSSGEIAGVIVLRLADLEDLILHGGHVGYEVKEEFRGNRYAASAVKLVMEVARKAGMAELWITCDPANIASKRTLEIAGGELVEVRKVAEWSPMHVRGRRESCRFLFRL